ncbi:MAG: DUF1573 domain-containing protein [Bacteroidota bacterium]
MMKKILPLIIFALLLTAFSTSNACAQTAQENIGYGDEAFAEADYYNASIYYSNALQLDSSDMAVVWKCAESFRMFNNYQLAEHWYAHLVTKDNANNYPIAQFNLALMQKSQGKYDEALASFNKYNKRHVGDNDYYSAKTKIEISACSEAKKLTEHKLNITIDHLLDASVNTAYSEFNAFQLGDTALIFSGLRPISAGTEESFIANAYISKVYIATATMAGWSRVREFDSRIDDKENHCANACFSRDHNKMWFTRGKADNNPQLQTAIYSSELKDGKWTKPEKLNDRINLQGYTATQPNLAEGKDFDILYFVSDRPGGIGKMDIWYVIIKDGKYQAPVNLGSTINTAGDDITPFYHDSTQTLYFSSDWHKGLGGFDIFYSRGSLNSWTAPVNIGFPLNSSFNDIYFTVNDVDHDGYFTSNRPGSLYIKSETCCNDIYYYEWGDTTSIKPIAEVRPKDTVTIEQTINLLLPLTLYFHNDEPDANSNAVTTKKNYKETLSAYYAMKDKYKEEYAKGLNGNEKAQAERDIDDFFENYVARGFSNLKTFSALLLKDLERGSKVQIKIKGYCSPLNTSEYNLNLAKRRISSLLNYMNQYDEGAFIPYLNGSAASGGKLTILQDPIGKAMANPLVSDNPNDLRNSVYSRAAAFERKIQIILYSSQPKHSKDSVIVYPVIKWAKTTHDFGIVEQDKKLACVFSFENTGASDLYITSVEASCGCTVVDWNKDPIPPGGESTIGIIFNTESPGGITETVTVLSNTEKGKDILFINADVSEEKK